MLILTAYNKEFAEIGDLCVRSIARYCATRPWMRFQSRIIPDDYPRQPSWFKVGLIRDELPYTDYILWIDADALIIGEADFRQLIKEATLNITKDQNGINNGVAAWRNCPEAYTVLNRIEGMYSTFKDHPWFEQAPLMEFVDELDVHYHDKEVLNAYQSDVSTRSQILHLPGTPNNERLKIMRKTLKKL